MQSQALLILSLTQLYIDQKKNYQPEISKEGGKKKKKKSEADQGKVVC